MAALPAGSEALPESETETWAVASESPGGNQYVEKTGSEPSRLLWDPPAEMQRFSFDYQSGHDPANPDGDGDTSPSDPGHFAPRYYAQAILRAAQYESPDPKEGQWRFLALVIQPDGLYLREQDGNAVSELGGVKVDIPQGQWHTASIEMGGADGNHVVVKHLRNGATETEQIEGETTIPGGGKVGFGAGSEATFRFDNAHALSPAASGTGPTGLRFHYDAGGRVVGRTLNPGESGETTRYYIYDNDRIVQELNEAGVLVAAWDYGVYIDELLAMHRDTDNNGTLDVTYYYLQDDLYNVVGLADASGNVVERYAYSDYGAPTIYNGDGTATRTESLYFNPFLFQGRRWDEFLKLYDYRTRYYDPAIGRFLRIDTIGLWGDANNLGNPYAFVGNNPWSNLDPYGESAIGKILRAAVQEGSEVGIKNKVRQEIKDGWYEHLQRQISKSGLKGMYEGHHIIAQTLFKDPALAKWFDEIGVLQHEAKNVTALPTKEAAKSGMDIGSASLHRGGPIPSYTADIRVSLQKIMQKNLPPDEALNRSSKSVQQLTCYISVT